VVVVVVFVDREAEKKDWWVGWRVRSSLCQPPAQIALWHPRAAFHGGTDGTFCLHMRKFSNDLH